jgi:hypothetical protein
VARFRLCIATALALSALLASLLLGQVSDEESATPKSDRQATHKSATPTPTATPKKQKKTPTPRPKKTPSKSDAEESETPKPKSSPAKKKSPSRSTESEDEEETPRHPTPSAKPSKSPSASPKSKSAKKKTAEKKKSAKETPSGKKKGTPPEKTPKAQPAKTPAAEGATPRPAHAPSAEPSEHPTPAVATSPVDNTAQLTIEKSGLEESTGLAPTPSPPPRRFWLWPWSRSRSSSGQRYSYLTRSVIEEIRRAPVASNRWKFIVVHNSGTRQGNARVFDYYHRRVRRMQNGLAYHFVIGNGTSTGNGEIEVGDRWRRQINGGHVHSDFLNNIALGICLVGDFNRDQPTRAQLDSCEELIRYLRERCGKADGRPIPVRPHREMNPPRWATDCPGDAFPYSWFSRF